MPYNPQFKTDTKFWQLPKKARIALSRCWAGCKPAAPGDVDSCEGSEGDEKGVTSFLPGLLPGRHAPSEKWQSRCKAPGDFEVSVEDITKTLHNLAEDKAQREGYITPRKIHTTTEDRYNGEAFSESEMFSDCRSRRPKFPAKTNSPRRPEDLADCKAYLMYPNGSLVKFGSLNEPSSSSSWGPGPKGACVKLGTVSKPNISSSLSPRRHSESEVPPPPVPPPSVAEQASGDSDETSGDDASLSAALMRCNTLSKRLKGSGSSATRVPTEAEVAEMKRRKAWDKRMEVLLRGRRDANPDDDEWRKFRKKVEVEYITASPWKVLFTRPLISETFSCGKPVASTIEDLRSGLITVDDIPLITVVERNGFLLSIDHRRLYAFRAALPDDAQVPMKLLQSPWLADIHVPEGCKYYHAVRLEKTPPACSGQLDRSPCTNEPAVSVTPKKAVVSPAKVITQLPPATVIPGYIPCAHEAEPSPFLRTAGLPVKVRRHAANAAEEAMSGGGQFEGVTTVEQHGGPRTVFQAAVGQQDADTARL